MHGTRMRRSSSARGRQVSRSAATSPRRGARRARPAGASPNAGVPSVGFLPPPDAELADAATVVPVWRPGSGRLHDPRRGGGSSTATPCRSRRQCVPGQRTGWHAAAAGRGVVGGHVPRSQCRNRDRSLRPPAAAAAAALSRLGRAAARPRLPQPRPCPMAASSWSAPDRPGSSLPTSSPGTAARCSSRSAAIGRYRAATAAATCSGGSTGGFARAYGRLARRPAGAVDAPSVVLAGGIGRPRFAPARA